MQHIIRSGMLLMLQVPRVFLRKLHDHNMPYIDASEDTLLFEMELQIDAKKQL